MSLLLIILIVLLVFGGGFGYRSGRFGNRGIGLVGVLVIVLLVLALSGRI